MTYYKHGDYNVICDRSGFKLKASETKKEWDGVRVYKGFYEERHPQDFVSSSEDNQSVPDGRPEGTDIFLSPNEVQPGDL